MKREETIKMYVDEYLQGKSEHQKEKFLSKDVNHQYASLMAWKRRKELKDGLVGIGVAELLKHIRSFRRLVPRASELSANEIKKLYKELEEAKLVLDNYDRLKAQRELEQLEQERRALEQRIDHLRRTVE